MIKENVENVLENYISEKQKKLGGSDYASFLRKGFGEDLSAQLQIDTISKFRIYGGCGQFTNWASVPWVLISDREITISAQKGYYLVYLFQADMQGVYLSLNQGWTQYRDMFAGGVGQAQDEILKVTNRFKNLIDQSINDYLYTIELHSETDHARGYELGHICGKYYKWGSIPDDSDLIADIHQLLGTYRDVKKIVGADIFNILNLVNRVSDSNSKNEPTLKDEIDIGKELSGLETDEEIQEALDKFESRFKNTSPKHKKKLARAIERNAKIANLIKKRDHYICQICGYPGFEKRNGELFAEAHHIEELSVSGRDVLSNLMCVCPTCHRILHYGSEEAKRIRIDIQY
jgi:5-methylcytosine-specific restriction enzyme A